MNAVYRKSNYTCRCTCSIHVALFPGPHPASCCLQCLEESSVLQCMERIFSAASNGKLGEGLGTRLHVAFEKALGCFREETFFLRKPNFCCWCTSGKVPDKKLTCSTQWPTNHDRMACCVLLISNCKTSAGKKILTCGMTDNCFTLACIVGEGFF